jgi:hypothetical protein
VKQLLAKGADANDGLGTEGTDSVLLVSLEMLKNNSEALSKSVAFVAREKREGGRKYGLEGHSLEEIEEQCPELGIVLALLEAGADVNTPNSAGTVPVFRQILALEDAIGSHACSFEANMRATNGIPLGSPLLLPVGTVNCVQTLKACTHCMRPPPLPTSLGCTR